MQSFAVSMASNDAEHAYDFADGALLEKVEDREGCKPKESAGTGEKTMPYTIQKQGNRWVASNGRDHVEAEEPFDAIYLLIMGEDERNLGGDFDVSVSCGRRMEAADKIGIAAVALIKLLAQNAPEVIIRGQVDQVNKQVDRYLTG